MYKMNEITRQQGRTVLLVTHNMQPVKRLCSRALWLDKGRVMALGDPSDVVRQYMASLGYGEQVQSFDSAAAAPGNDWVRMKATTVKGNASAAGRISPEKAVAVHFSYWCTAKGRMEVVMGIYNEDGVCVCEVPAAAEEAAGEMEFACTIPPGFLLPGGYSLQFDVYRAGGNVPLASFPYALYFEYASPVRSLAERKQQGLVHPGFNAHLHGQKIKT